MQSGGHGGTGVLTYANAGDVALRTVQLRFFDRHLKDSNNGLDREPRVQLFVQVPPDTGTQASGFWISGDSFPLANTQTRRLYLQSGGRANTRSGDGVLAGSPPTKAGADSFVYDPQKPVPSLGGGLCCTPLGPYFGSGAQDQSSLEARDDVLVYTSEPLTADIALIGQVKLKFWARSTARDTDFSAKLVDVYPSGFAQNVLDRIVRARFRRGSKLAPLLIVPGRAEEYEIDLGYTATMLKAGHRVRLDMSSSNFPHLARNSNTGNDSNSDGQWQVATQTVLHSREQPAFVELAVATTVKLPRP
jgi:putative CocE/NonD family hydrolase